MRGGRGLSSFFNIGTLNERLPCAEGEVMRSACHARALAKPSSRTLKCCRVLQCSEEAPERSTALLVPLVYAGILEYMAEDLAYAGTNDAPHGLLA